MCGGFYYLFKPDAAFFYNSQIPVRPKCGSDGREKFLNGKFCFFLVLVDIILNDNVFFRRFTRLTGAQDDSNKVIAGNLANKF